MALFGKVAEGQLKRYWFTVRLAFVIATGLSMFLVNAWAGFARWLVVPDVALVAAFGWWAWQERVPIGFLLAWRGASHSLGLAHTYTTTNRHGEPVTKTAIPQVRRLWYGPGGVRVNVLPVAGKGPQLESSIEDLTRHLGMSRGVIVDRKPGWRSVRYVIEFAWDQSRRDVRAIPAPLPHRRLLPAGLPDALTAEAVSLEAGKSRLRRVKVTAQRLDDYGKGTGGDDEVQRGDSEGLGVGEIDWRQFLRAVPVGVRTRDGSQWTISLYDSQGLLVVGDSGAGKSGVFWALNIGLAPALMAEVVEIRGLDPKGDELYHGREFFTEYADDIDDMVELLEQTVADMHARKHHNRAAGVRKYVPSPETPLVLTEIDEMMMFSREIIGEPGLAKRAQRAIITLLTQGRSRGFYVAAGIQDPRKEYLDQRSLFQYSVAMRMKNDMARLVLSTEAVHNGANCAAIPLEGAAGVGYVMDQLVSTTEAQQVRSFWCDEATITNWERAIVAARRESSSNKLATVNDAIGRVRASGLVDNVRVLPTQRRVEVSALEAQSELTASLR